MAKAKRKAKAAPAEDVLSAEELEAAAAAAEAAENVEEVDVEAAVAEVEADEARKETYSKTKAGKEKAAKPEKVARPRMSLETHQASEIIVTRLGENSHQQFNLVHGANPKPATLRKTQTSVLEVIDTLDKKTREKAVNLFTSLNDSKAPSVYTIAAIRFLKEQGEMTLKTLTEHFLSMGYKIGTARRQAGEMIALLPVVGVGTREAVRGAPVVFNADSEIAHRVLELAAPATK